MSAVLGHLDVFWDGVRTTLALTLVSGVIALLLGTLLAGMRVAPVAAMRAVGTCYVGLVRNVPLVVVFFFSAFVLPQLGLRASYFVYAVIALSAYYAAFFCEALRAGINAVAIGQAEAARALGLGLLDTMRLVVLPQAARSVVPPLINTFIALIKNTAVASAFGVAELLAAMEDLANRESQAVIAVLVATALFYLALTIPIGLLAGYVERRVAFAR